MSISNHKPRIRFEEDFKYKEWKMSIYSVLLPESNSREYLVRYISGDKDKMSIYKFYGLQDRLDDVKKIAIESISHSKL